MQRTIAPEARSVGWIMPDDRAVDQLVEQADPLHAFLRADWFRAAHADVRFAGYQSNGKLIAVFPLVEKKIGPIAVNQIAGPYWPFRSVPLVADIANGELREMLSGSEARQQLGRAWRLGPVQDNDPALARLLPAAQTTGWAMFRRPIAHSFDIDIQAMLAKGPWPSKSAIRQSRNYSNRLARIGEVETRHATGCDWTVEDRLAIAEIEAASWLAKDGIKADTKFQDRQVRLMWESIARNPEIAPHLFCSIMKVGGTPAAFTFGLEIGSIRYQIANNFNEEFKAASPGRILLTMNFADAAERGVKTINWGAGDAGYKVRYGAQPGPEIVDLLFMDQRWLAPVIGGVLSHQAWERVA